MIPCVHGCGQTFETAAFARRHVKYCRSGPNARNLNRSLDCAYCGATSEYGSEFKDFKALAEHVYRWHVALFAPSATLDDVNILLRQQLDAESKQLSKGASNMPVPPPKESKNGGTNFAPFLTRDNIKGDKATLVFLGAREPNGKSYSDLFVDVKIGRETFTWGLKADSRNYSLLFKRFGTNEKNWKGPVKVVIAKDKFINVAE
jgi:hypothetical protein